MRPLVKKYCCEKLIFKQKYNLRFLLFYFLFLEVKLYKYMEFGMGEKGARRHEIQTAVIAFKQLLFNEHQEITK